MEADGYRKVAVQPLHIFAGTKYQQLTETCNFFPGLRVFIGETLFHRWGFVTSIIQAVATEAQGFEVECPTTTVNGKAVFKGLAYYPQVNEAFISRLKRTLKLAKYY